MQPSHELTLQQCVTMEANHKGVCLACGIVSQETHPGVARAHCGHCGSDDLHGIEQALLLGAVKIRRDSGFFRALAVPEIPQSPLTLALVS
jgi:hypothetical protein